MSAKKRSMWSGVQMTCGATRTPPPRGATLTLRSRKRSTSRFGSVRGTNVVIGLRIPPPPLLRTV